MNELALFAGAGGGILGGKLLGWQTVCAVELDAYAASVLAQRQNDGFLEAFPIWSDVRSFDGRPWRGIVDVVSAGFPCTDISEAKPGAAGIEGEHSSLWREVPRIIREVRPRNIIVENSPILTSRGLGVVLGDLAELGFHARWGVLGAHCAGLDHPRERIWLVADAVGERPQGRPFNEPSGDSTNIVRPATSLARLRKARIRIDVPAPDAFGTANGLAYRMDRLKAVGNGQVPAVEAMAYQLLAPMNQVMTWFGDEETRLEPGLETV